MNSSERETHSLFYSLKSTVFHVFVKTISAERENQPLASNFSVRQKIATPAISFHRIAGNGDDARYANIRFASGRFQSEFKAYLPQQRDNFGPDSVPHTADHEFSIQYLQDMDFDAFLNRKGDELLAAVRADYNPVDEGHGAYRFVDTGGNVTMTWCDTFVTVNDGRACGADKSGNPVFGFADRDADLTEDEFIDGIVIAPILRDPNAPRAAKAWVLAEELNGHIANVGSFGVAINVNFESSVSFAQYVANTVSHELGHTFGLLDEYLDPPFKGPPSWKSTSFNWIQPTPIVRQPGNAIHC